MSAYYDLYQTPDPLGENRNEPRLHARILPRGTISADKFRELVAKATGFSPAILDGTLQAVTDELYSWLSEGWTVEVGELGYFSVSLKCDRQVTDKKEIRSPSVHFQNVNLRLGSKFRNRFNTMELERKASPYVSRSYLQSDSNVKKISTYITKKVSDRLQSIFKNDRKQFEEKWNDLKIFINYGMLTQEDFYDRAKDFALLSDTDDKYYTFEEYKTLIKDSQTDKDGNLIYLYANNKDEQYSYIEAAKNKGYNVLLMGGQLDVAMVSMLEQKFEKVRFTRVDSDVVDNLIVKEDKAKDVLEADKQEVLSVIFKSQLPQIEKTEFNVMAQALGENASPVMITQSEYMRRMKEMANIQAGMSFYGEMPDMFNLVLNADHKLVKEILADEDKECTAAVAPIQKEMDDVNTRRNELKKKQEGKKDEDIPTAEKNEVNDLDKKWEDLKNRKNGLFADYAAQNKVVRQLIDLALLQNGMLKGEALNNFVKRSIDLIK